MFHKKKYIFNLAFQIITRTRIPLYVGGKMKVSEVNRSSTYEATATRS